MSDFGRYWAATLAGPIPQADDATGDVLAAYARHSFEAVAWDGRSDTTFWSSIVQAVESVDVDGTPSWIVFTAADAPPHPRPAFVRNDRTQLGHMLPTRAWDGDLSALAFTDEDAIAGTLARLQRAEITRATANDGRIVLWTWSAPVGRAAPGWPLDNLSAWSPPEYSGAALWRALGGSLPLSWP